MQFYGHLEIVATNIVSVLHETFIEYFSCFKQTESAIAIGGYQCQLRGLQGAAIFPVPFYDVLLKSPTLVALPKGFMKRTVIKGK